MVGAVFGQDASTVLRLWNSETVCDCHPMERDLLTVEVTRHWNLTKVVRRFTMTETGIRIRRMHALLPMI